MPTDHSTHVSTRRRFLGGLAGATATGLAGCLGSANEPAQTRTSTTTTTATTTTPTSYSVSMEPVGEVTFESVPKRWVSYLSTYGDMAVALGQAEGLAGMYFTANYPTQFYDDLGIDFPLDDVPQLNADGVNKEAFYEVDADVHLMDQNMLTAWFKWQESDVAEVTKNVAPFVGNMIRRRGDDWHDYQYYTLYEAFGKVADVFQQQERYDQWVALHDDVMTRLADRLPAGRERPEVALISVNSDFQGGKFWGYTLDDSAGKKQYRDVGVRDAFADLGQTGSFQLDYEGLLNVDPDAILFHFGVSHTTPDEFEARMDVLRDDPVGSQLSAVQSDRLFRGGTPYQGPIINLYQTELAARQLYPDAFEGELFDRDRVRTVVDGGE